MSTETLETLETLQPQEGPQYAFLACDADVAFYGGAAGSGKTAALLMEAGRYAATVPGFRCAIFRRTVPEITNPGGLWDESHEFYNGLNGVPNQAGHRWVWFGGRSSVKFAGLQHEHDVRKWHGAQLAAALWDELIYFSEAQFFYMLSRLRSTCGVRPYVRATMNPDPDSWVRKFIDWWIGSDGLPIPERSGVIRYFARVNGAIVWTDTAEELTARGLRPRSFTFISARLSDNRILEDSDPDYRANLEALSLIERSRLLDGNWNTRAVSGMVFRRAWWKFVDAAPANGRCIRYWDRASSEPSAQYPDPDWTVGTRAIGANRRVVIDDVVRGRWTPDGVLKTIAATAALDGPDVEQWLELDPAQAGQSERSMYYRELPNVNLRFLRPRGSKFRRALPASAQCEAGNIHVLRAPWTETFVHECEQFADWENLPRELRPVRLPKDDQVDTLSGIVHILLTGGAGVSSEAA